MFGQDVQKFAVNCLKKKQSFEIHFGDRKVDCDSGNGNQWKPDIVITSSETRDATRVDVASLIGEIKIQDFEAKKPRRSTYLEHLWRAGARFCDIRDYEVPKFLLFPYSEEKVGNFDFDAYFRGMGVTLLYWNNPRHREMLRQAIEEL
jgi:hypothetical protein